MYQHLTHIAATIVILWKGEWRTYFGPPDIAGQVRSVQNSHTMP